MAARGKHFIHRGAPACRPASGRFWALMGTADLAVFDADPHHCQRCARSKQLAFIRKQVAKNP